MRQIILLALICVAFGCERQKNAAAPTTHPTEVSKSAPATEPTAAPVSYILIDEQPFEFPQAKLILKNKNQELVAILFSDDPRTAIRSDYSGNSFYLEMSPELPDDGTLAGAIWEYKATNSERSDSVSGIYLHGRKEHLQPFDVHVVFGSANSPVPMLIHGSFLMFDADNDQQVGKMVSVHAQFPADVKVHSAAK